MTTLVTSQSQPVLYYLNPLRMTRSLWRQRQLIRQVTTREIQGRYRTSFLGLFWSLITPLVQLLIYTFLFGVVFKSRWPQAKGGLGEYALILFCGLTVYNVFAECVNRSPGMIVGVPNYVKKVVFPLEILPLSVLGSALFHGSMALIVLMVASLIFYGTLHWTILLLPIVLLPMIFLALSSSWLVSSLGVFIRDMNYIVMLLVQILLFCTPIFYAREIVPEPFYTWIGYNPMTIVVTGARDVLLWGLMPDLTALGVWIVITGCFLVLSYAWFMKTKKAFADVL